ncbi:MAG: Crp/Fnr family transcriptional regulator [Abitibacteriaceae bacterium]|nr:Crp/Fnr family transcriptional regulator [Abditibacteriaceae bacterium]
MPHSAMDSTPTNWILAALPSPQLQRLMPQMRPVTFNAGQVLYDEGQKLQSVYFLDRGLVSLVLNSTCGHSVEVGIVGREGIVGTYGIVGDVRSFSQAIVHIGGRGWRMPLEVFQQEYKNNDRLHTLALQHLELLHLQAAQTALCNHLHCVEERLCRWLLLTRHCTQSDSLPFTQECIAQMLGVRRSGVTVAAQQLQEQKLIRYTRGHIQISDSAGLTKKACPCYTVLHRRFSHFHDSSRQWQH